MYICREVLTKQECKDLLSNLTDWEQGKTNLDKSHKNNLEIRDTEHNKYVFQKITQHEILQKYSFIRKMCEPRFNKYENSGKYNRHVDFFQQQGMRTDWSMTLFLTEPDTYEGGELSIEVPEGEQKYKLPAGDMIIYPSGHIHSVAPVTKGSRIAAIAWAESYVEDYHERNILARLVRLLNKPITEENKDDMLDLSFVYNNLMRKWSHG